MRLHLIMWMILSTAMVVWGCSDEPGGGGDAADGDADGDSDGDGDGDSDTDSDSDADPSGPIEFEQMCDAFVYDGCKAIFTCPELSRYFDYQTEEECQADLPCRGFGDLEVSLENGWFEYDADAMGTCHDMLLGDLCGAAASLPSDSIQGVLLLCPEVIQGNQSPGQPCMDLADCQRGSFCSIVDQCPGTCVEMLALGDACEEDNPDMTCNELEGHMCMDGICSLPLEDGVSCEGNINSCGPGLLCGTAIDFSLPAICQPLGVVGGQCSGNNHCVEPLVCTAESDTAEMSYCSEPLSIGAFCNWDSQCAGDTVCSDDACAPAYGQGEMCEIDWFGADSCAEGFICRDAYCRTIKYIGETCAEETEACAESICVDGVCVERLPDGAECDSSYDCHSRFCSGGICADTYLCENQVE